jgi:thiol-disulfide isomerase/thioredoxin
MRVLLLALVLSLANCGIIELDADNFVQNVKDGEVWAVAFYSPTCGFCKMIEPEWERFAQEVDEDELPLTVARINVKDSPELSKEHNVGRLPGIKLYRDGNVYSLPNPRDGRAADEYVEWALETYEEVEQAELDRIEEEKRLQAEIDAASDLVFLDKDNFETETSEGTWLIEFYGPQCGYCKKLAPMWEELGHTVNPNSESMGFKVGKIDAHDGFTYTRMFKANPWPAIKLLKDEKVYTFPEPRNFDMEVDDYIEFAQSGWEDVPSDEVIEVEYIEAARKRIKRKKKYQAMKERKKKKAAEKKAKAAAAAAEAAKKHDEL